MALYRRGTASMDADGTVHGTDTKWKDQLALIRVGATIVFLEQPIKLAVISDIVSDTELKAISTDGQTAANGKYVILLNDSLTVNGLAQNVAETLRYYQSKETEIAGAIDLINQLDMNKLEQIVAEVNQAKSDSQDAKNQAELARDAANAARDETNSIKNQTQQIIDGAVGSINSAKDQAVANVQQKENSAVQNINSEEASAIKAINDTKGDLSGYVRDAQNASQTATSAKTDAQEARDAAVIAKDAAAVSAQEAKDAANSVDAENLLYKDNNLNDLTDKSAARQTLNAIGVGDYGIGGDAPNIRWNDANESTLIASNAGSPMGEVSVAGLHVKFSSNYAVQFAARQSRFFWRTKENGVLQNWCEAVKPKDYGLGIESSVPPPNTQACFFSQSIGTPTWAPANGAGFQSAYAPSRVAQVMVGALPALYYRWNDSGNAQVSSATKTWSRVQDAGTSDARVKDIKGNLNVEAALDNINRLEFKLFRYTFDEPDRSARRGIIAQQAATVDKEYVHYHGTPGMMTLDLNPLLSDSMAAIKALRLRDEDNKKRISDLESRVYELEDMIKKLTESK